ncbi:BapA/Bap/LapF family large adhesin, partial [Pectobacterium cacticida]|uniref:BapA/Bap/LapF family large adhesin n=1 Tax=Pectobacterium cacticida TaxID=69221 RepID=UPI0039862049
GETVTATATDAAGNVSEPTTATAPDTTAPEAPANVAVAEDGSAVSGNAEPGSTVTLTDASDNIIGSVEVGEDGSFTIPLTPALTNGETVTATATDAAGNVSEAATAIAPTLTEPEAPEAPTNLAVAEDGSAVSGNAEPGSTVTVTDGDGNNLGSVEVGENGSFTLPLNPALTNGETVSATATDAAGNSSAPTTATAPDITAPDAPTNLVVAEDGTAVSGNAEPGSTVTITDGDGNNLGSVEVGEDGSFTIPLTPALTNGETITATATDAAGNVSEPTTATAPDTTAPEAPANVAVAEDGTAVSGNAEPGSTVTITDGDGNNLGSVEVGEDGSFTIPLTPALTNGETITATATDPAGNSSAPTTATAPDTTAPNAPIDLTVAGDGTAVSGNAEPGSTATVTDASDNILGSAVVNEDGSFTISLTPALLNGESVTATATDAAGNVSAPTTATAPDITAPDAPTNLVVVEDGTAISGNAESGSTVTLTDASDNILGSTVVDADGSFTIPLNPALTNGETVTVTATDPAGNSSAPTTATAPDITEPEAPANVAVAEDGNAVSGNAEPGSTVTITDGDGNNLGSVEVGEDGSFTLPLNPALTNGETVTATATDAAGNVSAPTTATAPDTTAPEAPANVAVAEDGSAVSGNAEPGSTVTITDGDGNNLGSVEVGEDGSFTIPLNPALTNGETVTATATDPAGNSSAPTTATAPDITEPEAPANVAVAEDGNAVSGNAEPGSTVTITDGDGNNLGSVEVGEDGSFTLPLNPALTNGETVTATATDAAGNVSAPTTATAPDTTAPEAPANVAVAEDGTAVSGNAEPGSTVTVTDGDGNNLGSAVVDADGSFTVPLTPPAANGESLTVTATDAAGNVSAPTTATAPDITAPDTPHAYISEDGLTISGTAEAGSTVTVTLPDGSTLDATAADDGTWSLLLPETLNAGQQLTVTATDNAGNTSTSVTVTVPDTSLPDTTPPDAPEAAVSADGLTVSGDAEPDSTITITLPDGTRMETSADAFGRYTVELPAALLNGESLTVTATDAAGNVSEPTTATAPDITAPDAPTNLVVAEDGSAVSGNAEPGSTVTVTDASDNILGSAVVNEDGSFTISLTPALLNGESVTATATDAAGNVSAPTTATAPDITAPEAPTNLAVAEDGSAVSGNAEPGSTVNITDGDGNTLGSVEVGEDGSFTLPLNPPLTNGETVSATATDAAGNSSEPTTATAPMLSLEANDNEITLNLTADAEVTTEHYSDWGFLVVGALGDIVSLLGDDSAQVTFTIDNGATADVVLEASATGGVLSLLNSMGVIVQQYDADTSAWNTVINTSDAQWASLLTIGSNSITLNAGNLEEGTYRALTYNTTLLALGSYTAINATVTQTAGTIGGDTAVSGNVITDIDPEHGADVVPPGTLLTQVVNSAGEVTAVTQDNTTIQGEYGTLSISQNGDYTYTLTDTSPTTLGQRDTFSYTLSANGVTTSADLIINLGEPIIPPASNIMVTDDDASIVFDTTVTAVDNGTSAQSGFTLLNIGLGEVLNVGILDDMTDPIIFNVEDGTTRTMTLQATTVGLSVATSFNLYIYEFDAATQQYKLYREEPNWLRATLVAGTSDELTLTLDGGQYLFLLDTASGVSAITGYTLNILEDHVYTVGTVSASTAGNVMEDDIAPENSVVSRVNGVAIAAEGTTDITGAYGVLSIDAQGHYTYTLNAGIGADGITAPDSFVYTVTAPDGGADSGTLNIHLSSSPLTAVDDSVALATTAAQVEGSYSDNDVGSATWTSSSTSGSGSGTISVAENTAVKGASIVFDVNTGISLSTVTIDWTLSSSSGAVVDSGSISSGVLSRTVTVPLGDVELAAGDYTLNIVGSGNAPLFGEITIAASVAGTSVQLDNFQTAANVADVEGNIFDGSGSENNAADQLVSVETALSITDVNGTVTTLDPYVTSDATATIAGHYGVLTLNIDGSYRYALNDNVALEDIIQKETFDYTLTADNGETANATLTIDLALQVNGSRHDDIATSSAYDDTFSLGAGADTLIFNLLDDADTTGGNGSDSWTDFSLAEGDRIDISQLLQGWDGSAANAGDWISVESVNGNTVISIDRDGQGSAFSSTELITLQSTQLTLDELLENNAIIG